jgi:hypothetical protein
MAESKHTLTDRRELLISGKGRTSRIHTMLGCWDTGARHDLRAWTGEADLQWSTDNLKKVFLINPRLQPAGRFVPRGGGVLI